MKNLIRTLAVVAFLVFTSTWVMAAGELDVGVLLKAGPVDEGSCRVAVNVEEGNFSAFGKYNYSERNRKRYDEKGHVGIEYDKPLLFFQARPEDMLSGWLFGKVGTNFAQRIRLENYLGGGLKYTILDTGFLSSEVNLSLSAGYLHHFIERYDDSRTTVHRASIRPKASFKQGPWDLRWTVYYQPSIDEPEDDHIIQSTASAGFWLNKTWGIKLEREDEYRSMAAKDKRTAETSMLLTTKW